MGQDPSTYVAGDIQGCLDSLKSLCDHLRLGEGDRLWLVGDLVNRGPHSVETLRFVRGLGDAARVVLGNHDLATLAAVAGVASKVGKVESAVQLMNEPDAAELIDWLRRQPLMHVEGQWAMVHGGLLPQWTIERARELAGEVETMLRGPDWQASLHNLFGNEPDRWDDTLTGWGRLRVIVNAMTRLRFLSTDGAMQMKAKGTPEDAPPELLPWFSVPDAAWRTHTVLCGHWSALGFRDMGHVVALDSGCVWGGCLTAMRLEDRSVVQVKCPQYVEKTLAE